MPQSLSQIIVHLVFSVKDRQPLLIREIRPALHAYLSVVLRDHECPAFRVGGVADHVHLAFALSRKTSVSDLVETLKVSSSKWIKQQFPRFPELTRFSWQRGYGAFSIGESDKDKLIKYIDEQEEHHRAKTFQDEYRIFLKKYQIQYDERYVWD